MPRPKRTAARPRPHVSVSAGLIVMWPNSPAAPFAPATMRPSEMTAPPTPVPSVMNTTFSLPRPPPFRLHPSPQHSRRSRPQPEAPTVSSRRRAHIKYAPAEIHAAVHHTVRRHRPGMPAPTPKNAVCGNVVLFSALFEFPPQYHAAPPCRRPQSRSESPTFSSKVPSSSNKPSFTVVPPMSAPMTYFLFFSIFITPLRAQFPTRLIRVCINSLSV